MNIIAACDLFYKIAVTPKKRGIACIMAENEKNRSNIDRFPINKPSEAKKAIQRINTMTKTPKWWDGSLDEIKEVVMNKINELFNVETIDNKIKIKYK